MEYVTSRGAPSPGKVRNLDSPRACGVAKRRTSRTKQEAVGYLFLE